MKTSTSLIQLLCTLIVLVPMSHCTRVAFPNDATSLIDQTCKKTQEYQVCVSALKSDPQSATADVLGLALILVDVVNAKGIDALNKVNELLKQSPGNKALQTCAKNYHFITEDLVSVARQALPGQPKFGVDALGDCASYANECEEGFSGGPSPLTEKNKYVHDVSDAAMTIARTFL